MSLDLRSVPTRTARARIEHHIRYKHNCPNEFTNLTTPCCTGCSWEGNAVEGERWDPRVATQFSNHLSHVQRSCRNN